MPGGVGGRGMSDASKGQWLRETTTDMSRNRMEDVGK